MKKHKILCACKDRTTNHVFMIEDNTGDEGYLCLVCSTFKKFDKEGGFDAVKHYNRMKLMS